MTNSLIGEVVRWTCGRTGMWFTARITGRNDYGYEGVVVDPGNYEDGQPFSVGTVMQTLVAERIAPLPD